MKRNQILWIINLEVIQIAVYGLGVCERENYATVITGYLLMNIKLWSSINLVLPMVETWIKLSTNDSKNNANEVFLLKSL